MTRHEFFVHRLKELGMYDADADYNGAIGESVEELSKTFAEQHHSGASAAVTLQLFNTLMTEWDSGEGNRV